MDVEPKAAEAHFHALFLALNEIRALEGEVPMGGKSLGKSSFGRKNKILAWRRRFKRRNSLHFHLVYFSSSFLAFPNLHGCISHSLDVSVCKMYPII